MTEHLPECPVERMLRSGKTVGSQTCICKALRACEQRVIDAAVQRVQAFLDPWPNTWLRRVETIAAVRGDQP